MFTFRPLKFNSLLIVLSIIFLGLLLPLAIALLSIHTWPKNLGEYSALIWGQSAHYENADSQMHIFKM